MFKLKCSTGFSLSPPITGYGHLSSPHPFCEGMGAGFGANRPGSALPFGSQPQEVFAGSQVTYLVPGPAKAQGLLPGFIFI